VRRAFYFGSEVTSSAVYNWVYPRRRHSLTQAHRHSVRRVLMTRQETAGEIHFFLRRKLCYGCRWLRAYAPRAGLQTGISTSWLYQANFGGSEPATVGTGFRSEHQLQVTVGCRQGSPVRGGMFGAEIRTAPDGDRSVGTQVMPVSAWFL
jgi:hypothetical protein